MLTIKRRIFTQETTVLMSSVKPKVTGELFKLIAVMLLRIHQNVK